MTDQQLTPLLGDLQRLINELNDGAKKKEGQPADGQTGPREPAPVPPANAERAAPQEPAPASLSKAETAAEAKSGEVNDVTIKADGQVGGLVIGVGAGSAMKLERLEVTPEPDGSLRIMVRAKREET
jgi:hypothetical protein